MKESYISEVNNLLKDRGSFKMFYNDLDGRLRWLKVSVDDKRIDIYPFYSAKVSVVRSRPFFKVQRLGGADYITIGNNGKKMFKFSISPRADTEKITFSKKTITEGDGIEGSEFTPVDTTTPFSREVARVNDAITKDGRDALFETGFGWFGIIYYTFKYSPTYWVHVRYVTELDTYEMFFQNGKVFDACYEFKSMGAETYVNEEGMCFTRVTLSDDKGNKVGTFDVAEKRRD